MDSTSPGLQREPIFTMPGLVVGAIVLLVGIHGARALLSNLTDFGLVLDFGFVPAQWSTAFGFVSAEDVVGAAELGSDEAAALRGAFARYVTAEAGLHPWSWLSYALLHGSWMHVALNCVWLAAFATPVVRRCGTARSLVLAAATALGGSLAHWLAHPLGVEPMIGASAIVSGLMGAAATFVFDGSGSPAPVPAGGARRIWAGLGRIARNRTALMFLGSWFVINLVFGLAGAPIGAADASIAWEAHVGGLLVGLILFPLIEPVQPDWHRWVQ